MAAANNFLKVVFVLPSNCSQCLHVFQNETTSRILSISGPNHNNLADIPTLLLILAK
jgi:hypothetical protein